MAIEPRVKRAGVFVDGQNLFHAAKEAFGYRYPNFDVACLAQRTCAQHGWILESVAFYTGIPDSAYSPFWSHFWTAKLAAMGRNKVRVFTRPLRYHDQLVALPSGELRSMKVGQEKGIDVRLALDVISCARRNMCDVALIMSQDQDLSELAREVRALSREQQRWMKIACAFPFSPHSRNQRGIDGTDWIRIDRAMYEGCIDTRDYRPRMP